MIEGYVKEVLIKEMTPQGVDKVFVVRNLPKHLLYREVPVTVTRYDRDGYTDGTQVPDPSGAKKEDLLDGLEIHKHDGAICFPVKRQHVREALDNIDRYIDRMFPRDVKPAGRIPYAERPGDMRSNPLPRHRIPVVDVPLPKDAVLEPSSSQVSPRSQELPVGAGSSLDLEAIKAQAIEEYKEQQKELKRAQMAKAREARTK